MSGFHNARQFLARDFKNAFMIFVKEKQFLILPEVIPARMYDATSQLCRFYHQNLH
jgi:hypothetical protein